jgi:hypothetical protein
MQVEADLITAGGFGQSRERGIQGLWGQIRSDIQARKSNTGLRSLFFRCYSRLNSLILNASNIPRALIKLVFITRSLRIRVILALKSAYWLKRMILPEYYIRTRTRCEER